MSWSDNALLRVGDKPSSRWSTAVYHLPWVVIAGFPLAVSFFARVHALPKVPCGFLRLTGLPCPTCGYTRTFCALSDGRVSEAWVNSPAAVLLYVFLSLLLLWNGMALVSGRRIERGPWLCPGPRATRVGWMLCGLLVLMNWVYRILSGFH